MTSATTEAEFAARAEQHRRELHVHCYRMLGNFEEAEDIVQETLLRAWRRRDRLERDEWFRAWLYKIATNACLDAIKSQGRRLPSLGSFRDVATSRGSSPIPTACWPRSRRPRRSPTPPSSRGRRSS